MRSKARAPDIGLLGTYVPEYVVTNGDINMQKVFDWIAAEANDMRQDIYNLFPEFVSDSGNKYFATNCILLFYALLYVISRYATEHNHTTGNEYPKYMISLLIHPICRPQEPWLRGDMSQNELFFAKLNDQPNVCLLQLRLWNCDIKVISN